METSSVETTSSTRSRPYLVGLMALLCIATFFEGYDFFIISLIIDLLAEEFTVEISSVLNAVAFVNIGAILGFFVIRLGDRIGRKPIVLAGVLGYASLSLATAACPGLYSFMPIQFLAKMFLVTEFGMAIVIVTEEFPPKIRATSVAILEVAGALGGGAAMISSKYVLPEWGWRGMYVIGGAPLVLLPVMFFVIKETQHFQTIRTTINEVRQPLWHIWTTASRKFVALVGAIWFLCYLGYAGVVYHWVLFAKTERGWSETDVGLPMTLAALVGMTGFIVSGAMMDTLGRKITGIIFFLGSAGALVWAFTASGPWMIPSVVAAMFFVFAILPICSTYNAELFPTEIRANATAWCNFLLGRPAQVFAPLTVAQLSAIMGGYGNAVAVLAVGPLIAALLVWRLLPETKGIKLDEVG